MDVVYSRTKAQKDVNGRLYAVDQISTIPALIRKFIVFVAEKWKIARDKGGSGNTANIGSVKYIPDLLNENGVFVNAGEAYIDDYWSIFGKIEITTEKGQRKKLSSFAQ